MCLFCLGSSPYLTLFRRLCWVQVPTEPFGSIPKSSSPCGELMKGWAAMTSAITSVRTRNVLNRGIRGELIVGESLAAWRE